MGVMDKFLNCMKLNYEDEEFYEDDYDDDDVEVHTSSRKTMAEKDDYEERLAKKAAAQQPKVTPIRKTTTSRKIQGSGMEVCVIRPKSVEDAREITETLLNNRPVILNLEDLKDQDADIGQRILDFTSGSCFAIDGNLQRISNYIFIITPASVDISGDIQEILGGAFDAPLNNSL